MSGVEAREILTPGEVAAMFRIDPKTVSRWAKKGWLPAFRTLGGDLRFYADDVAALMAGDGEGLPRCETCGQATAGRSPS